MSSGIAGLPSIPDEWVALDGDASDWPEGFSDDRRRGRAVAVQVLYEVDLTKRDPTTVLDRRIADDQTPPASARAARAIVSGVVAHLAEIDRALADGAPQWPVLRIDPVERSILRLATCELLHGRGEGDRSIDRVPVRVAINEAVELARLFGTEASVRFVNGVLGAVVRQVVPASPVLPDAPRSGHEPTEAADPVALNATGGDTDDRGTASPVGS
jgi:N utilization substance protein B